MIVKSVLSEEEQRCIDMFTSFYISGIVFVVKYCNDGKKHTCEEFLTDTHGAWEMEKSLKAIATLPDNRASVTIPISLTSGFYRYWI